jgi:hypothetical protein
MCAKALRSQTANTKKFKTIQSRHSCHASTFEPIQNQKQHYSNQNINVGLPFMISGAAAT